MRCESFAENQCFHLCGRGSGQAEIFLDDRDYYRFIFLLTHLQSPIRIFNTGWYTERFAQKSSFGTRDALVREIVKKRSVELIAFSLLPHHFHLLVRNLGEGLISVYMQRVLTAYSKYFNAKYGKRGHVFEGPFKAAHTPKNSRLLHLSAFIHKSPQDMAEWRDSYDKYPYSTYQDYIGFNRWGGLLCPDMVLKQFKNQADYKGFVGASQAQEL